MLEKDSSKALYKITFPSYIYRNFKYIVVYWIQFNSIHKAEIGLVWWGPTFFFITSNTFGWFIWIVLSNEFSITNYEDE